MMRKARERELWKTRRRQKRSRRLRRDRRAGSREDTHRAQKAGQARLLPRPGRAGPNLSLATAGQVWPRKGCSRAWPWDSSGGSPGPCPTRCDLSKVRLRTGHVGVRGSQLPLAIIKARLGQARRGRLVVIAEELNPGCYAS